MSRPIGSRSGVATEGELRNALRSAYDTAIRIGSDWEALPGSVRLPWLDHAHDLAEVLDRVHSDNPIQSPPDMTPFPELKALHPHLSIGDRMTEAARRKRHLEVCAARQATAQPGDRAALAGFWRDALAARRQPAGDVP